MPGKNLEEHPFNNNPKKSVKTIFDISYFKEIIKKIKSGSKNNKKIEIGNLFSMEGIIIHYTHKTTGRVMAADCLKFEYPHEKTTAEKIAGVNYDILFAPKGYFSRNEKKFDVFLCRNHIFLEADLKCIMSSNPDTIAKRIKSGSEQSSRLVLDMHTTIKRRELIEGMKSGCERNNTLIEILLFYNSHFYCLSKTQILSKKIYSIIK